MTMLDWWRQKKRERILARAFPAEHVAVLERNVKHYLRLLPGDQKRLRDLVQVFVAEKRWEGCGGLVLTEEMKLTIAAQACLLVLELPHSLYENVESILVYPSTIVRPAPRDGVFVRTGTLIAEGPRELWGEAHHQGPVVLAWDRVLRDGQRPCDGHNLVYHEFAHKLDMLDGHADGTPPLVSREERRRWHEVFEAEFLELRERAARGEPTFIDEYGSVDEAEFFAVVTEHFFDQPAQLREAHPALYDALRSFYRQDPAVRCESDEL
jgi:Mlc titration factor MtfA (ptsG expression regulator)